MTLANRRKTGVEEENKKRTGEQDKNRRTAGGELEESRRRTRGDSTPPVGSYGFHCRLHLEALSIELRAPDSQSARLSCSQACGEKISGWMFQCLM